MSESLPAGWVQARLSDLFASITDGDHLPPPQTTVGIPFLVIGDVRRGTVDLSDTRFVAESYYESLMDSRRPRRNDVLYTVTGSFGIPVLVDTDRSFCVQRHIAILRPSNGVSPRFFSRILAAPAVLEQAFAVATGTAQKTVPLKGLRGFVVPVPPEEEQHRIVEQLDSYLTRLDDAVSTLERVQRNLKRYRASVLKAAVEGRLVPTEAELARAEKRDYEPASKLLERILVERRRRWEEAELAKMKASGKVPRDDGWKTKYEEPAGPDTSGLPELPEGWCWTTVDALAQVKGGITKDQKLQASPGFREVPYLRVANVQRGYLDLREVAKIRASEQDIQDLALRVGDVLFNEGGDRDKLGRGWVWNGEIPECIHQNHVFRARIYTDDLQPKLLSWYGNSSGQQYFFSQGKQTTNLASINSTKLKSLPVPIPPKAEQSRLVAEVERRLSLVDESESLVDADLKRCSRLRQSILKWAFEGKLVDQDPTDEPASVLLERIRAERAAPQEKTPSARKPGRPAKRS